MEFLGRPDTRERLVRAADAGDPPVAAISEELRAQFGLDAKVLPVRQFVGLAVKGILAEEGFSVAETGVRIPGDPVFTTGATYSRQEPQAADEATDWVRRVVEIMDANEAAYALRLLEARAQRK
jgi:hypothetical protein